MTFCLPHLQLVRVDPCARDVQPPPLLLAGAVGHAHGAVVQHPAAAGVILLPGVQLDAAAGVRERRGRRAAAPVQGVRVAVQEQEAESVRVVLSACYRRLMSDCFRLTYIIYCLPPRIPFPVSCRASPSGSAARCYGMLYVRSPNTKRRPLASLVSIIL